MPVILYAVFALTMWLVPLPAAAADLWPYRDQLGAETRFWKDIFTKYGDDSFVLHDPEDLSLVYKTISYSPDESDFRREQRLTAARYEVENALRSLAGNMAAGRELTVQEKKLRQLFGASASPQHVKLCASRIRAQRGIANRFYQGLQRSTAYLPAIKKIFRDKGLPEGLAYLPHVESSFNLTARSKAGAAGMWQFMKPTAKTLSLKMNAIIDERYDPLVASEAAASLLKMNYDELGDWGLALTAYNYGLGGMAVAVEHCGGNYMNVRRKYQHPRFQFASKNFYPEFIAAVEIMENPAAYFPGYAPASRHHIVQHRVKKPSTLPALAKNWGLELSRLRELNPGYSKKAWDGRLTIPSGYSINIPAGSLAQQVQPESAEEKSCEIISLGKTVGDTGGLVASRGSAPVGDISSRQEYPAPTAHTSFTAIKARPSVKQLSPCLP
jgi:membrane-bound lytic murein transglycosylase D